MTKPNRTTTPISIRLTSADRRTLRAAARTAGLELGTWLRAIGLAKAAAMAKAKPKARKPVSV